MIILRTLDHIYGYFPRYWFVLVHWTKSFHLAYCRMQYFGNQRHILNKNYAMYTLSLTLFSDVLV